jgi:MFS transporter, Spinster family, sphingosine-1-phosphate transporter
VDQASPEPVPEPGPEASSPSKVQPAADAVPRWAWGVFALLFAMHLLDSAQRWLLPSVLGGVSRELRLSETQAGWLSTMLLLGFTVAAPPIGYVADRLSRSRLLALGFALGSLATVGTGLARTYDQLQVARVLVGVGGAAFMVIALTILMDVFPLRVRGRVLAGFLVARPLGAGSGTVPGATFSRTAGWQTAFLAVGAPGLLLALLALAVPEPVRGWSEGVDIPRLRYHEHVGPSREDYIDLMVNSSYTYSVFGLAFASFAIAGLVYWLPTFLKVARGLAPAQADGSLGATLLAAAVLGIGAGGWLADAYATSRPRMLFSLPGLAMLGSIAGVLAAIYAGAMPWVLGGVFLAVGLMFLEMGPCYTITSAVVMPNMRGVACAATLSAAHLLGDLWSPTLMGWVIDTFGERDSMATGFGQVLAALGAVPVAQPGHDPENLTAGMLAVLPALLISGVVLLAGSRHLPREMALMLAKLRAAPSRRVAGPRP